MRIKTLAAAIAGAAMLAMSAPQTTIADTLTVTSWGGSYSMSQRKALHEPFMKETGHVVLEDEWDTILHGNAENPTLINLEGLNRVEDHTVFGSALDVRILRNRTLATLE